MSDLLLNYRVRALLLNYRVQESPSCSTIVAKR